VRFIAWLFSLQNPTISALISRPEAYPARGIGIAGGIAR
jgi:hypothetical protein